MMRRLVTGGVVRRSVSSYPIIRAAPGLSSIGGGVSATYGMPYQPPCLFSYSRAFYSTSPPNSNQGGSSKAVGDFRRSVQHRPDEEQKEEGYEEGGAGNDAWFHLPFMPPFHTVNIVMLLIMANITCYLVMRFGTDDIRDLVVEHFTLSHSNAHRIYPFFTSSLYQEHFLQLAIDVWLLMQFGRTMLGFLGGVRMATFWAMTSFGGGMFHVGRQWAELYYGMDPIEVRGRCFGPNPFILGLVGVEGLIFRNLNFMQNPPIPFLILTAFVMIIDVWRIFTTKPQEHGASTGGALVAFVFWRLPTRMMGLDKLTAAI